MNQNRLHLGVKSVIIPLLIGIFLFSQGTAPAPAQAAPSQSENRSAAILNHRILLECWMGRLGYKFDIERLVKHSLRRDRNLPKTQEQ